MNINVEQLANAPFYFGIASLVLGLFWAVSDFMFVSGYSEASGKGPSNGELFNRFLKTTYSRIILVLIVLCLIATVLSLFLLMYIKIFT